MTDNWPWQTGQPRQTDQRRQAKAKPGDKNQLFLQNANSELCVSPPTPTPHLFLFFLLPFTSTTKVAVPITVMHIVQRLEVNETVQIHNGCEAKSNSQDSFLDCLHHSRCISLRRGVMTASLNCRGIANDNTDSHTQTHTHTCAHTNNYTPACQLHSWQPCHQPTSGCPLLHLQSHMTNTEFYFSKI